MPNVDDDLRQAVIDEIMNSKQKPQETIKEISAVSDVVEKLPAKGEGAPKSKYDLGDALKKVVEKRKEQSDKPSSTDKERKMCNEQLDKGLLRDMMGRLRR